MDPKRARRIRSTVIPPVAPRRRRHLVAAVLATAWIVTTGAVLAQPTIRRPTTTTAPTVPPNVPAVAPSAVTRPAPNVARLPAPNNVGANTFQANKPLIAPNARLTPAVAMVVQRSAKHADFPQGKMIAGGRRTPIDLPALPATLGANGPPLTASATIVVDNDGRKVPAGDYQADTYALENYLNKRGITQRTREPSGRHTLDMKRKVARAQLPSGPGLLRPNDLAKARGKPAVLPIAPAQTLSQASASLWESGDSVTLDRFPSKNETRKPPPIRLPPPPPPPEEIDRPESVTTWYYKSGGSVGLDMDANGTFASGRKRRKAGATVSVRGYVSGIDFPLFDVASDIESTVEHTYDKASGTFGSGAGSHAKKGSLAIMGIGAPVFPAMTGFDSPPSWRKPDSWTISAAVPVGPFLAQFSFTLGYEVGARAKLGFEDKGLGVTAEVGPTFGAYGELTAGVGLVGFSVGVGGHVAFLGNQNASGPGSFTRRAFSRYEEAGFKQRMVASTESDVWALSGNLFAFVDTWWDRYDTEIFSWSGIKLGASDLSSGNIDIAWGTFQEPDYGPLRELRAFACKQKNLLTRSFPHDWIVTTRTKAEMVAGGCELIAGPNDSLYGRLASKWNPDTVPVAECRNDTTWIKVTGPEIPSAKLPVGTKDYTSNEYPVALWKQWTTAPSQDELMAAAKAECEVGRSGPGQRISVVRIAGYGWKAGGEVLLDAKKKVKGRTAETFRCAERYDWWLSDRRDICPNGPMAYPNGSSNFYMLKP